MHRTLKRLLIFVAGALLLAGVATTIGYAVAEPKSSIGFRLFCLRYDIALDKSVFLTVFSRELLWFEGGTIPAAIDGYLVRRFSSTDATTERAGIADFYVCQQLSGRPGDRLHEMGEPLVVHLFNRLPHYDAEHQLAALAVIEGCRRADSIGKFYFTPLASAVSDHKLPLEAVVRAYERWWHSSDSWPEKSTVNPIAELPYDWSEP